MYFVKIEKTTGERVPVVAFPTKKAALAYKISVQDTLGAGSYIEVKRATEAQEDSVRKHLNLVVRK